MKYKDTIKKLLRRELENVERQYRGHCEGAELLKSQKTLSKEDKELLKKINVKAKELIGYEFFLLEILEVLEKEKIINILNEVE